MPKMKNPSALKVLKKAKTILLKGGWCRNAMKRGTRHCLVGALRVARYGHHFDFSGIHTPPERKLLSKILNNDVYNLTTWNDKQRSSRSVIALLDKAIKLKSR